MSSPITKERFKALDLLRGFFIVTIICDHLSRWPSLFQILSGKALLWVTAAEGFVIISGLLIGYIRGFKSKSHDFKSVAFKIWRRALTLYTWAVLGSILYTTAIWYIPLIGGNPTMPYEEGDWFHLIVDSLTLNYTFVWIYFLKLYAIFLAAAPLAVWLLRKGYAWVIVLLSFGLLALGWLTKNEVLQWQIVFFMPVIAGYYMPTIQEWWQRQTRAKRLTIWWSLIAATLLTIALSIIGAFYPELSHTLNDATTTLFAKDSMSLFRLAIAFLWFTTYVLIFIYFEKFIARWFGWLLMPIGTHSLTAYILHGVAIIFVSYFFISGQSALANTLLDILAILIVWALLKIPGINRVIPR